MSLSFQIVSLSLGRGVPSGEIAKVPENRKKNNSVRAACCNDLQNEAGTVSVNWHKSDTGNSRSVLADQAADLPLENETAAQAGPLNGGEDKKRTASSFRGPKYYEAVSWFKKNRDTCARPIIKTLCRKFNLKPLQACQAIREANGGAQ